MKIRRITSLLLSFVMAAVAFAGCTSTDRGDGVKEGLPLELSMAQFGSSNIAGVVSAEPADLAVIGDSQVKTVTASVGGVTTDYTCRTLSGVGSEMSFTLEGITPGAPLTVEIEEIHQRADGYFSYTVYVNGTSFYRRAYDPISDGSNHFFFDVPSETVGEGNSVNVRIVSEGEQEIRFFRVWAISDLKTLASEQGIDKKMDLILMLNEVPSDLDYNYLADLVEAYRGTGMYEIGLCWEIQYMKWGKARTEEYLDGIIKASVLTGAPLYLGINSWWSGTPYGPDGLGGYWQDVKYHQITYDPRSVGDEWQLTTPNGWGNNPWLSMNDADFNSARHLRIAETMAFLQKRTAEHALSGEGLPDIHVFTENEPIYWPINWYYYDIDRYPDGIGDFSPTVIAAAEADGIILDPTDGLSDAEAEWMFNNLHRYIYDVGEAMAEGAGYNYVTVKNGEIYYPEDQMVSNAYTHSPLQAIYPTWDGEKRAWENHVLPSIHFGGEWAHYLGEEEDLDIKSDARVLDYLIAYGSYANVNAERSGIQGNDFRFLSQAYAYGLEGVVFYNVLADSDHEIVKQYAKSHPSDGIITVKRYGSDLEETVYFSDLNDPFLLNNLDETFIGAENLRYDGFGFTPRSAEGGSVCYRLTDKTVFERGITVELNGREEKASACAEIFVGSSPETLEMFVKCRSLSCGVFIPPSVLGEGEEVYLKILIYTDAERHSEANGRVTLSNVNVIAGSSVCGRTDGVNYTRSEFRIRNLTVAARADVERMLGDYLENGGLTADAAYVETYELYAAHRYGDALKRISAALSEQLPARFMVSGFGKLGNYPLQVEIEGDTPVSITLLALSDSETRFTLSADAALSLKLTLTDAEGVYSLRQNVDGSYSVTPSQEGTAAQNGQVSFDIAIDATLSVEYPKEFDARLVRVDQDGIHYSSQDPAAGGYADWVTLPLAPNAVVRRGSDGIPREELQEVEPSALCNGDYIKVTLDSQQRVSSVDAWYGVGRGTVVKIEPASVVGTLSNPKLTVLHEGREYTFEITFDCQLLYSSRPADRFHLTPIGDLGLTVGQTVTIYYCPYIFNGRIRAIGITD